MKKKIRRLTVGGNKYVCLIEFTEGIIIKLSPAEDKTARTDVVFGRKAEDGEDSFPERITAVKDGEEVSFMTDRPAGAVLMLELLGEGCFISRKTLRVDGYGLLEKNGYRITGIKNGLYW
ncbi:hypothetical protein [Ruminococcus sp.]|uniref:hypothetical protein n=1 Tax=Ruminococcus sp. TaxID=41978 RepID=UPI0025FDC706|nr:hypothetical protein [Ruminococcus sp.]MBQ8967945.1 hypothetical protein [Ruminococcus sp.]